MFVLGCVVIDVAYGQANPYSSPFIVMGDTLAYPYTGGFQRPIFSNMNANSDGIQDVFIFDKGSSGQLSLLLGNPTTLDFTLDTAIHKNWPLFDSWAISKDFDCDGSSDMFTYHDTSLRLYRGIPDVDNGLQFQLSVSKVWDNSSGEFVRMDSDISPEIVDVDNDGDLDVLTASISGQGIWFYKNQSVEYGYGCDSMLLELEDECWGGFTMLYAQDSIVFGSCENEFLSSETERNLHSMPSFSLLDLDDDMDMDILWSGYFNTEINAIINEGNPSSELFSTSLSEYIYPLPLDMNAGPKAYYLDLDNDSNRDLILSKASPQAGGYNSNISLMYLNVGTDTNPSFEYNTSNLFSKNIIDEGYFARPSILDYNGDGLMDIILSAQEGINTPTGSLLNHVSLFENTGTIEEPIFERVTQNFAGLADLGERLMDFSFGDFDNDGDLDFVLGNSFGEVMLFQNDNGVYSFLSQIADVGNSATPQLYDLNEDGLWDLIIGEASGNLNYYENTGTLTSPIFTLVNDFLGEVDVRQAGSAQGYSSPSIYKNPFTGITYLYVSNFMGAVHQYQVNASILDGGAFTLITDNWNEYNGKGITSIEVFDVDSDSLPEFILGTEFGGMSILSESVWGLEEQTPDTATVSVSNLGNGHTAKVYPTIIDNGIWIETQHFTQLEIFDISGRKITYKEIYPGKTFIEINTNSIKGNGFVRLKTKYNSYTKRIMIL